MLADTRGITPVCRGECHPVTERVAEAMTGFLPEADGAATVSIGIALRSRRLSAPVRLETPIEAAYKAVYAAKSNGRNRVVVYSA